MDTPHTLRWCGPADKVEAALLTLGDPRRVAQAPNADGNLEPVTPADPRIVLWGDVSLPIPVGEQQLVFLVLQASEAIPLPAGLFESDERLSASVVGQPIPDPPRLVPLADWFERVDDATQQAVMLSTDPSIRFLMARAALGQNINLADPRVINGLAYAASIGLLTEQQRLALLA